MECKHDGAWHSVLGLGRMCVQCGRILPEPKKMKGRVQTGKYESLAMEIGRMIDVKQAAYGDSIGITAKILRELYPNGIKVEQYDDLHFIIRMIDKICRITKGGGNNAQGEDAWKDLAGYSILRKGQLV